MLLEIICVVINLLSIVFFIQKKAISWIFSLLGSLLLLSCIHKDSNLIGQSFIQIIGVVQALHGLFIWQKSLSNKSLSNIMFDKIKVRRISSEEDENLCMLFCVISVLLTVTIYWYAKQYIFQSTESYNLLDAFITFLSIHATFLLSMRFIENWKLWIYIDILSIVLFALQGRYFISLMYFVFIFTATKGLKKWELSLNQNNEKV